MSHKREQGEGKDRLDGNDPEDKRRRVPTFRNVVLEVMRMQSVQHLVEPMLEPLIRRVVREEVELALRKHLTGMKRNFGKEMHHPGSRNLQIQFLSKLSLPVFTGTRIEGEDCSLLKVALVDGRTGLVVCSEPESSAKVEIVVLEGDFDSDESDRWTVEDFKNNIVREREGKKPLLAGDVCLNLKEGFGLVGEISFTDNSSWTRSRRFRLGARVVDGFDGIRVREAKSESFIVRDHRGELYRKHHPPSLYDEVWRLEKIGKDGAFHRRLTRENIKNVKDFLTLLFIDPPRLRNILGTGMSTKMWEVTVEHAQTCVLDKRIYLFYPAGSQQNAGVIFNIVGQALGLLLEGQYVLMEKLSETDKVDAHNLVISAFKHWDEVVPLENEKILTAGSDVLRQLSSSMIECPKSNQFGFDYSQPTASSPDFMASIYSVGAEDSLDDHALHDLDNMHLNYDQPFNFNDPMICDTNSISQSLCGEDRLPFLGSVSPIQPPNHILESQADLHTVVSGFLSSRSQPRAADKAHRRWTKISSVLKWFSIRRVVASKKSRAQRYN